MGRKWGAIYFVREHLELTATATGKVFAVYEGVVPDWRRRNDVDQVCEGVSTTVNPGISRPNAEML